jgi:hypothetical protein
MKIITLNFWIIAIAALAGCATPGGLPPGSSIDAARHLVPAPTAEYALPNGGTRLEFDRYKQAWMLDFSPQGVLQSSMQALTEQNFATIEPGMPAAEVRLRLGRPIQVFGTGWVDPLQIWNYRFAGGDCVWFQVSIWEVDQKVRESSIGTDPACDGGNGKDGSS